MHSKQIRLVIGSDLENVDLIGMTTEKICSLTPFTESEIYQIELCVVEAVNNSIEHAYNKQSGHEVEVVITICQDKIILNICDTGKNMDPNLLEKIDTSFSDIDLDDIESIPEEGRGLPLMKSIMDSMSYKHESGKNCLRLTKEY